MAGRLWADRGPVKAWGAPSCLLSLLSPEIVLRADFGRKHPERSVVIRSGDAIAGAALAGSRVVPALVNGAAGAVIMVGKRPFVVMGFIVTADGKSVEINAVADAARVRRIAAAVVEAVR